jgi:hypothetical protein
VIECTDRTRVHHAAVLVAYSTVVTLPCTSVVAGTTVVLSQNVQCRFTTAAYQRFIMELQARAFRELKALLVQCNAAVGYDMPFKYYSERSSIAREVAS